MPIPIKQVARTEVAKDINMNRKSIWAKRPN